MSECGVSRLNLLRKPCRWSLCLCALLLAGCESMPPGPARSTPFSPEAGVNRRQHAQPSPRPPDASADAEDHAPVVGNGQRQTHMLNPQTIIRMVYEDSPLMTASREARTAADFALEEFRANLSRFEPFVESRADASRFPKRRDSEGVTGEVVGGIQKETFEGAIIRLEGGASASRFKFGDVDKGEKDRESGGGGLVRGRLEVPFVGSRKRQERVISQAFQESTARQAELNFLSDFRTYVTNALSFYQSSLLYLDYVRAYERKIERLEALEQDERIRPEDRPRLASSRADAAVFRDQHNARQRESQLSLLAALGLGPDTQHTLEESEYQPSPYLERSLTPEGLEQMILEAYENNPRFRVLNNAIRDAEVQKQQAILGQFDVTAFVQGTQYAFGSETYDDRVGGWALGGGVTVRLNDQRVLSASRQKAEANIRRYKAQIEAERLDIQRRITTQTETLHSNEAIMKEILGAIEEKQAQFAERARIYLNGLNDEPRPLSIDDVLIPLNELTSMEFQLASNRYSSGIAETALQAATGEVYRVVGMRIENGDNLEMADED
jgi:hypothetical protein